MEIQILGAHQLELKGTRLTSLLIDGTLVVDAGGLTCALSLPEQKKIKTVLLTHHHFDHTRDLVTLAANAAYYWQGQVVVYALRYTLDIVTTCLLDGKIYAINAKTGDLEWEFDTGSPIVSSPVWDGDLLIVASESGDIYVFDTHSEPENKVMMPAKTVPIDALIRGSLCVQDSTIYVRAQDNCLYALDIEKGWISWRLPLNTKGES